MLSLNHLTIRTKTIIIAMICTIVALLISVVFNDLYERHKSQALQKSELTALATILAERSTAAIQFGDNHLALQNLAALKNIDIVIRSCMYDSSEQLFAYYYKTKQDGTQCSPIKPTAKPVSTPNEMHISQPIILDGKVIGYLEITATLEKLNELLLHYLAVNLGFCVIAILVALTLASRVQRFITRPIAELTQTANDIEKSKNYHLRAKKTTFDEIGHLANAFNNMLSRIETENIRLKNSEERFRTLTTSSPFGVFQTNLLGEFSYVNQCWRDITNIHDNPINNDSFSRALHPEDRFEVLINWRNAREAMDVFKSEFRLLHDKGRVVTVICEAKPIFNHAGDFTGYLGSLADISELKSMQAQMERLALYDSLTELANRRLFKNRLEKAISSSKRTNKKLAVLFIDFDDFKKVNDSMGHDQGDELLITMAKRLRLCTRKEDTISRLGGDEFTILIPEIHDKQEIDHIAKKIFSNMKTPLRLKGRQLNVTCSMGIAIYPDDAQDTNSLIKNADMAMYKAKDLGRNNYCYYSEELNQEINRQLRIEADLREALKNREFQLFFQPKIELSTGQLIGYEALIRWNHPEMGLLTPIDFISVAEDTDLITPIGEWVFEEVCKHIDMFLTTGKMNSHSKIAINLSPKQFRAPNLLERIRQILIKHGTNPSFIEIEITESLLMDNVNSAISILNELRTLGIQIAIDDFGTGYSSFNYLKRLPIDVIKIDRSFVKDIPEDKDDMEIISAIIAMAHKLRLTIVAEGVETKQQRDFLSRNNCDIIQGYLIGKPTPATDLGKVTAIFSKSNLKN